MTRNIVGSFLGGIQLVVDAAQNLFDPGTAVINYEETRRNGVLCIDTNERSWTTWITDNRLGFGLGNISHAWGVDTFTRLYGPGSETWGRPLNRMLHQHESTHIGQQRVLGLIGTLDLAFEQLYAVLIGDPGYPYFNTVGLGLEKDAFDHENDRDSTDNFFINLNRWRWW
jgi:hypothetical protein